MVVKKSCHILNQKKILRILGFFFEIFIIDEECFFFFLRKVLKPSIHQSRYGRAV